MKCGFIIYNENEERYLIVFSKKSRLWGFPKGTFEEGNDKDFYSCAIRELEEESGYRIMNSIDLNRKFMLTEINNIYYYHTIKNIDLDLFQFSNCLDKKEIAEISWRTKSQMKEIYRQRKCNKGLKEFIFKYIVSSDNN